MKGQLCILSLSAPEFVWQSPLMLPTALGIGALLLTTVLWLYPRQVRQVGAPWRWTLPALRTVVFLALAVSLARPVAMLTRPANGSAPVIVLIDRSRSMGIADAGRRPADLVATADALGLLPAGTRAEVATRLTADLDQLQLTFQQIQRVQGELEYARVSGRGIEAAETRMKQAAEQFTTAARGLAARAVAEPNAPAVKEVRDRLHALAALPAATEPPVPGKPLWTTEALQRLNAAAASLVTYQSAADRRLYDTNAQVRTICARLDQRSRLQLSLDAVQSHRSGLGGRTGVIAFAFADDLTSLGELPATPPATNPSDPLPAPLAGVKAEGRGTDLNGAVAAAIARTGARGAKAVVVFSDGRQAGPEGATGPSVATAGVPVFTVAAASSETVKDIGFGEIDLPRRAFVGETVTIRANLRGGAFGVDPAAVRLRVDDGPEQLPVPRDYSREDGRPARTAEARRWAEFTLRLDQPGVRRLTLSMPAADGEATAENNTVRRWIKVLPEKIAVAAYACQSGWDFQYFRSALRRPAFVSLDARLLDPAAPKLPLTPEQIQRLDVLVLHDVPVEALDANQWDAVSQLVQTRGGSVIFVAGPASAVAGYSAQPLAAALLPFRFGAQPAWRVWAGERASYHVVPSPAYDRAEFLRLEDGDVANRRWQELPALFRLMPVSETRPNVRPILVDSESRLPVLTEAPIGQGRAFFLGVDETWRWRFRSGEREQERFWRQLVRYAAEEPYGARVGPLALDTEEAEVRAGQPIPVRARLFDPALGARAGEMKVDVLKNGTPAASLPVSEPVAGSGRFRATIPGLAEGAYEVRLSGPAEGGGVQSVRLPLYVTAGDELELQNVTPDLDRLRRLAESTGGQMLRLDQLPTLNDRLAGATVTRPQVSELPLWQSPYLFVFVIASLAAEWALRKRCGLS